MLSRFTNILKDNRGLFASHICNANTLDAHQCESSYVGPIPVPPSAKRSRVFVSENCDLWRVAESCAMTHSHFLHAFTNGPSFEATGQQDV